MTQHFSATEQHSSWIGHIFANSFREGMTCTLKTKKLVNPIEKLRNMQLTGSKTTASAEYDAPATTPAPPTKPEAKLSIMLPYKFGVTMTSN